MININILTFDPYSEVKVLCLCIRGHTKAKGPNLISLSVFSNDTRRSASAAPLSHGATSLKIHVSFADVGAKSVDVIIMIKSRLSELNSVLFLCVWYLFSLGNPTISSEH